MVTGVLAVVAIASIATLRLPDGVRLGDADSPTLDAYGAVSTEADSRSAASSAVTPLSPVMAAEIALDAGADIASAKPPENEPQSHGDDSALDRLWDGCEAGNGRACDRLFELAPVGSDYERFGLSCGNRDVVLDCHLELDVDTVVD